LHTISGINVHVAIIAMALIALSYTLISGLRASILTDSIQMVMLLAIAFVLVLWCVVKAGGVSAIVAGLAELMVRTGLS